MLFSENRYDLYGACDPIFGMRSILAPDPKLWVLIIPKYRITVSFRCCSSAYRLSEKNIASVAIELYVVDAQHLFIQIDMLTYCRDIILEKNY